MATILIVDDEFSLVESISEVLRWEGHRVLTASHGAEGLAVLDGERPDLILLDQMMPVMGGLEMLRRVRADVRHHDMVVLLMSAAPVRNPGGPSYDGLLRKPFDVNMLLDAVNAALKKVGRRGGGGGGAGGASGGGAGATNEGEGGGGGGGGEAGGPEQGSAGRDQPVRHLTVVAGAASR